MHVDGYKVYESTQATLVACLVHIRRKAWLFSYTNTGVNASAILYSLLETAKANNLIVRDYIVTSLQLIAENPNDIDALLPWNIKRS